MSESDVIKTAREIERFLKILKGYYKSTYNSYEHDTKEFYKLRINFSLIKRRETITFILPKTKNLKRIKHDTNEYIIDIFSSMKKDENVLSAIDLYHYFINSTSVYEHMKLNDPDFSNIESYYVDRSVIPYYTANKSIERAGEYSAQDVLVEWSNDPKINSILLLGERGFGKTWTVKKFFLEQYKRHITDPWLYPLPLYFSLKYINEDFIYNVHDLITYYLESILKIRFFPDARVFRLLSNLKKIILIFDGLDEITNELNSEYRFKYILDILDIVRRNKKVILTSRIGFFPNFKVIDRYFAQAKFSTFNEEERVKERFYLKSIGDSSANFNIFELGKLKNNTAEKLKEKYLKRDLLKNGVSHLTKIVDKAKQHGNIQYEIHEISKIPIIYDNLVRLFGSRELSNIQAYNFCIKNALIQFNIDTDRAISSFYEIEEEKFIPFGVKEKMEILGEIAWYLFERNKRVFVFNQLPKYIRKIENKLLETIIENDLRLQTVLTVDKNGNIRFIIEGIHAYFVAYFLYEILQNPNKNNEFVVTNLGLINFTNRALGKRALIFLSEMLKDNEEIKDALERLVNETIESKGLICPSTRYLMENIEYLPISISMNKQIIIYRRKLRFEEDMIFVPVADILNKENCLDDRFRNLKPFLIGKKEVTNDEFMEFLKDSEFEKEPGSFNFFGGYWARNNKWWKNNSNPHYKYKVINDYHLLYWIRGEKPKGKGTHPVVYVSWFSAACFCNWLSKKKGIEPYYSFEMREEKVKNGKMMLVYEVYVNNKFGYRLPTVEEWEFTAREGNCDIEYPWERSFIEPYENPSDYENFLLTEGEKSHPVMYERPNLFGVYGLIGNVREWTQRSKIYNKKVAWKKGLMPIKGSTWILGKEGYRFRHVTYIYPENTNHDVGFRIARSLSPEEFNNYSQYNKIWRKK